MTDCNPTFLEFQVHNGRRVVADFDGGDITSDAGVLLLRQTDERIDLLKRFGQCFSDLRNPYFIEHSVLDLVSQRVYGLCLGYEDVNDHDDVRRDRLMALAVGKQDIEGQDRRCKEDRGIALAGKSTLNRLELIPELGEDHRYHRISYDPHGVDFLLTDIFLESRKTAPKRLVLDLDTTDDILHGNQEGRFFHGYYGNYCYTPLYIFCGEHLLLSRLQSANVDGAVHAVVEVSRIVAQIRKRWPSSGSYGYFVRQGAMWNDPAKTHQDRRTDQDHGAKNRVVFGKRLSLCRCHQTGLEKSLEPCPSDAGSLRLKKNFNNIKNHPVLGDQGTGVSETSRYFHTLNTKTIRLHDSTPHSSRLCVAIPSSTSGKGENPNPKILFTRFLSKI